MALAEGDIPVASGASPWTSVSNPHSKPPEGGDTAKRIIRKPIKKVVRRPVEGGDQGQQGGQ